MIAPYIKKKEVSNFMNYAKEIKEHLSNYKIKSLKIIEEGIWKGNKKTYSHILPFEYEDRNLIFSDQTNLNDFFPKSKRHSGFHHLNSSQAMCVNFFFLLIKEKKLDIILDELRVNNEIVNYDSVEFEKESKIDKKDFERPTNFDFYFKTESGKKFFFEIKYTENEFGKTTKKDYNRKQKRYEEQYKGLAKEKIKFQTDDNCTDFLDNYQIMRNLIHVSENRYVVFVVPENNKIVYKQAKQAEDFVIDKYKDKVKLLTWDSLYKLIDKQNFDGNLKAHFDEFKLKYKL